MKRSSSCRSSTARRFPSASLLLVAFAVAASLLPGLAAWLQYDRLAIARGELWRLLTCHFVHWSGEHLFWDVLALGVLGWLCEQKSVERFVCCVTISAALIPLGLWIAEPGMATYRGLSGIDSALFAMLAARILLDATAQKDWWGLGLAVIVSVGFAAKVHFELSTGATLFVDSADAGMTPVPLAHVIGGIVGLACVLPMTLLRLKPCELRFGMAMDRQQRHLPEH